MVASVGHPLQRTPCRVTVTPCGAAPRRTRWSHCCDDYRAESRSCLCESANGSISRHAALFFLTHVCAPVIMALSQHIAVPRRAGGLPCPLNLIDILTSLALFTVRKLKKYAHISLCVTEFDLTSGVPRLTVLGLSTIALNEKCL